MLHTGAILNSSAFKPSSRKPTGLLQNTPIYQYDGGTGYTKSVTMAAF